MVLLQLVVALLCELGMYSRIVRVISVALEGVGNEVGVGVAVEVAKSVLLHLVSLEDDVALRAPLLILLDLTLEPVLKAIRVEEVPACRNPHDVLALLEGVYADHTLRDLELVRLLIRKLF